ncbi:hypothetical protein JB92DRAFT_2890842 [Gautieria morchelliformis]|nr:hypothetical protein JB92DRAFT_2890842 [Gautieria morchelliformis]
MRWDWDLCLMHYTEHYKEHCRLFQRCFLPSATARVGSVLTPAMICAVPPHPPP